MHPLTIPASALAAAVAATASAAAVSGPPAGRGGAGSAGEGTPAPMIGGAGVNRLRAELIQMALMLRHHDYLRFSPCFAPLPMPYKLDILSAMAESRMALAAHGVSSMLFLTPQCASPRGPLQEDALQRNLTVYFYGLQWFRALPSESRDGVLQAIVNAKLRVSAMGASLMVVTVPNGRRDARGIPLPVDLVSSRELDMGLIGTLEQRYDEERVKLAADEAWMPEAERKQLAVARTIQRFILPDHDAVKAQ